MTQYPAVFFTESFRNFAMLNDANHLDKVYILCGFTDLRMGIDGLASIVQNQVALNPFTPRCLFLFCGRRTDRIKGLVWEEDGFLLVYKRLEQGKFIWPRNEHEVQSLSREQYQWLMQGLTIAPKRHVEKVHPEKAI